MRSQYHVLVDVKGICHIPGWVILRRVQCVKSVVDRVHIWSFINCITHGLKNLHNLIDNLRYRVLYAVGNFFSRLSNVDFLCLEFRFLRLDFHLSSLFGEQLFKLSLVKCLMRSEDT